MFKVINSDGDLIIETQDAELAELVTLASSIVKGRFHKVLNMGMVPAKFNEGRVAPRKFEQGPVLAQEIHDLKRAV